MTNWERITASPLDTAWALTNILNCDMGYCVDCGIGDKCPLFGEEWTIARVKEQAHRLLEWLQQEAS